MFRKMRRFKQELSPIECEEIMRSCTYGTLAIFGEDGYPYALPLSFVYCSGKIYFHSAKSGKKIDDILKSPLSSFCVVAQDDVKPEEYTTYFKSVIAFGSIHLVDDEATKIQALTDLGKKYNPTDSTSHLNEVIAKEIRQVAILEFYIDHLTGKQSIELIKNS